VLFRSLMAKLNDRLRCAISDYRTKVVVRSHAHYFNHIEFSGSKGYVTPCWKALDEFMLANGPLDISPDIGFLPFIITQGPEGGIFTHEKIEGETIWSINDVQTAPLTVVPYPGRDAAGVRRPRAARR